MHVVILNICGHIVMDLVWNKQRTRPMGILWCSVKMIVLYGRKL